MLGAGYAASFLGVYFFEEFLAQHSPGVSYLVRVLPFVAYVALVEMLFLLFLRRRWKRIRAEKLP
jgi:hypothetical protein